MVLEFVKGMLGDFGRSTLAWMAENPLWVSGVLALWLAIFLAGRLQLWYIERQSVRLVLEMAQQLRAGSTQLTAQELYRQIYPRWNEAVRHWAWFIPHRLDLWPVPARPEAVQKKLAFSPEWIAEVLQQHNLPVEEGES